MDILFAAHLLENLRPDRDTHFPEMSLLEKKHQSAGLADASPDAERDFVVDDCPVVRALEPVEVSNAGSGKIRLFVMRRVVHAFGSFFDKSCRL
jgi:hypothetical protein